jgi:hypothetical protein
LHCHPGSRRRTDRRTQFHCVHKGRSKTASYKQPNEAGRVYFAAGLALF